MLVLYINRLSLKMKRKKLHSKGRKVSKHTSFSSHNFEPLEALDLSKINNFDELTKAMSLTAFGGRELGEAVDVTESMVKDKDCFKVLTLSGAMTMAQMSLLICDMIDNKMVDAIVSSAGGVEEDFIKCFAPFYLGSFDADDIEMRKKGLNRIGNIFVPSENYVKFESWLTPIFKEMYVEQ